MNVKDNFHHLIDGIEDEQLLEDYYKIIQRLQDNRSGKLWDSLNEMQQQEVILSYDESFNTTKLISNDVMKKQHERWLKQ